jgi:hypothetical protein
MHENPGFLNERQIINKLNNTKFKDLTNNLKFLIQEMFGICNEEDVIKSGLIVNFQKLDIYIELNGIRKYVSLKSGQATTIAEENLKLFIKYLRSKNISTKSLKTILYYHFGDGTLDGSGEKRMEYITLRIKTQKIIKELNEELNKNLDFVIDFVIRSMFKGTNENNIEADYIYFGNVEYGVLASKKQVIKHLQRKSYKFLNNPHIGPIQFRPHARYFNKEIKSEKRRWTVDFYRPNLSGELSYISNRYDG